MEGIRIIAGRELKAYFETPVAYVFIVIFLALMGVFTFYLGGFYERGQADLSPFFNFHPWLYLFLVPAIAMRLWAEERKTGLALTFPIWLTVNYLGNPDNGVIVAAYIGSWLMAGGFLAIGSCISAANKNQVVAFIITVVICFVFLLAGFPLVLDFFAGWAPQALTDTVSGLSFLTHFNSISKGVIDLRDVLYFLIVIGTWLYATAVVLDLKKAD
jgi:ABC-2 type transport system permease protein